MSPYEIAYPGGSVEHNNEEAGRGVAASALLDVYHKAIWLNPQPEDRWGYYDSIGMVRELMGERMFPLTLAGWRRGCGSWRGR